MVSANVCRGRRPRRPACTEGLVMLRRGRCPHRPAREKVISYVGRRALTPPRWCCGCRWKRAGQNPAPTHNKEHLRAGRCGHRPLRAFFFLTKSPSAPKGALGGVSNLLFYFLALLSTTWRSRAANASRDMAPRSPSARCRGETVPFSMSRSPTTTM